MSFQVCVDANIVLKLVLNETDSAQAVLLWQDWLRRGAEIIAPYHLIFETTSVLTNYGHRRLMTPEEGQMAFALVRSQPIQFLHPSQLTERTWTLAQQFKRPTAYDCFYLALAELTGCELWTADRRLYSAVTHSLPWVKWLGDYRAPA